MFNKISFYLSMVIIAFSVEGFAKKIAPHEQAPERRTLRQAPLQSKKIVRIAPVPAIKQPAHLVLKRPVILKKELVLPIKRPLIKPSTSRNHLNKNVFVNKSNKITNKMDLKKAPLQSKKIVRIAPVPAIKQPAHLVLKRPVVLKKELVPPINRSLIKAPAIVKGANTGLSYVNIDGVITRGHNIKVTPGPNGVYNINIDGARIVVKNPLSFSSQNYSSSSTFKRNGQIKEETEKSSHYYFTTRKTKIPFIHQNFQPKVNFDFGRFDSFWDSIPKTTPTIKKAPPEKTYFTGATTLKNVKKTNLNVTGPFQFSNLDVKNNTLIVGPTSKSKNAKFDSLKITGPFEATDVTCNQLKATGPMTVTNLKVQKASDITGPLHATKSHFHNLTIASDDSVLKDTMVEGNIFVRKPSPGYSCINGRYYVEKPRKQVLRLQGKTTIKGTIIFEAGTGIIEQSPLAKIQRNIKGVIVKKTK